MAPNVSGCGLVFQKDGIMFMRRAGEVYVVVVMVIIICILDVY